MCKEGTSGCRQVNKEAIAVILAKRGRKEGRKAANIFIFIFLERIKVLKVPARDKR